MKPLAQTLHEAYKNVTRCKNCGSLKSNNSNCENCQNSNKKYNKICYEKNIDMITHHPGNMYITDLKTNEMEII